MPTFEEAFNATNPADSEEVRNENARKLLAGAAANAAYWDSRSELEALKAAAVGHGAIVAPPSDSDSEQLPADAEATAVDEGSAPPPPGVAESSAASGDASTTPKPTPDNPTEAVSVLRKQLTDAGLDPEA